LMKCIAYRGFTCDTAVIMLILGSKKRVKKTQSKSYFKKAIKQLIKPRR